MYNRKRYYDGFTVENTALLSYSEMCFNIAEGVNRGWAIGNADDCYQRGIKANFAFYGVNDGGNTVTFQRQGAITLADYVTTNINFSYADYFAQTSVKYAGNNTTGLNQILTQKYLAFARNVGLEGYYQWRRTGVPTFGTGSGTSTNATNYNNAIAGQYAGKDDIFAKMWIIQ